MKISIHNVETDELIQRDMNEEELLQWEKDQASAKIEQAEAQAKAQAKAQLLAQLGITEEQAKLLLS